MAVGVARAAYEHALRYAKEREIWGQPIGKYQAVGQMLVDMKADLEMARLMVRRIAWQNANKNSREGLLPPNLAKVYPTEMARRVTIKAMQIFGGSGYMKDYPLEKLLRDAMVLPIISGANEVLKHFMSHWHPLLCRLASRPPGASNSGSRSTMRAACSRVARPAHMGQKVVAKG